MLQIGTRRRMFDHNTNKRSPLSSSSPNACPQFTASMGSKAKLPFCMAPYRQSLSHNPLLKRQPEQLRDQRRQAFLVKVRHVSDDRKWNHRSEQVKWQHERLVLCRSLTALLIDTSSRIYCAPEAMGEYSGDLSTRASGGVGRRGKKVKRSVPSIASLWG